MTHAPSCPFDCYLDAEDCIQAILAEHIPCLTCDTGTAALMAAGRDSRPDAVARGVR